MGMFEKMFSGLKPEKKNIEDQLEAEEREALNRYHSMVRQEQSRDVFNKDNNPPRNVA